MGRQKEKAAMKTSPLLCLVVLGLAAAFAAAESPFSCERPDVGGVYVAMDQSQLSIEGDDVASIDAVKTTDIPGETCFSLYSGDELAINRDSGGSSFGTLLRIDCAAYMQGGEFVPFEDDLKNVTGSGSAYSLCLFEGCSSDSKWICAYGEGSAIRKLFFSYDDTGAVDYIQNIWIQSNNAMPGSVLSDTPIAFQSILIPVATYMKEYGPATESPEGEDVASELGGGSYSEEGLPDGGGEGIPGGFNGGEGIPGGGFPGEGNEGIPSGGLP